MKVLLISQYFHPTLAAVAQLMSDLGEDLAARGDTVTVLCGRARYTPEEPVSPREEVFRGIRIRRVPSTDFGKGHLLGRLLDYCTFLVSCTVQTLRLPRQDVALVLSTPPLSPLIGVLCKWWKGTRLVYSAQDIYPELAVRCGVLHHRALIWSLRTLARFIYRRADRIITLGECMRQELITQGAAPEKIAIIPNWSDGTRIVPIPKAASRYARNQDWVNRFVILYSGNMGLAHDFDTVNGAMAALRDDPDLLFAFIGGGNRQAEVTAFVRERQLPNVQFHPYVPREDLPDSLVAGDVHLVVVREGIEGLMVPSKIYGALAAGRPILYVGNPLGAAARAVREGACGTVIPTGDVEGLVQAIRSLQADPDRCREQGRRARALFEQCYDRSRSTEAYRQILGALCAPTDQAPHRRAEPAPASEATVSSQSPGER